VSDGTRDFLLGRMHKLKAQAQEILDTNEREGRDESPEQVEQIKKLSTEIAELQVEVKKLDDRENLRKELESLGTITEVAQPDVETVAAKTLGEALVRSPQYKSVIEQAKRDGFPRFSMPTIELKAVQDAILESDGSNADAIAPTWDPTLYAPGLAQFPLRVADLLTISQVANGNSVNYPIVKTRTAPTGNPTSEGEDKKAATFEFDFDTATLEKNTAFTGVSEEMFQDAPVIVSYINNQLGLMVQQVEEASITTALYTAVTQTADGTGIGGDNGFDAMREAITVVQVAGAEPDGILIHPNDAAFLDVQRAVAGDGAYFSGGPYGAPRSSVWGGLRLVVSTSATEGTALLGAFRVGATLYRKGGLRLDTSNSHDDWFRKNIVAIRAELRSITAVHNPELFVEVTTGLTS
jgi:HK97 family phage major capsid protein